MNSFVITRELAAVRRDELLAEAARDRLAHESRNHEHEHGPSRCRVSASAARSSRHYRPAQYQAIAERTRHVAERFNRSAAHTVRGRLP